MTPDTPIVRPPPLTADVNALAWGQFYLRGGWMRLWGFVAFYTVGVGSLIAVAILSGNATPGGLKLALTGVQCGILVLFMVARVSTAVRQDLNTKMIESHRLMPMSPAQAVIGYLLGPALHPLGLAAANVLLGLFASFVGGVPAGLWLTVNAVLLEFAFFVALAMLFGAISGKGSNAAVWLGFFVAVYSHAVIGFILPALNVLATPLAGRTVFGLASTADAAAFYAPPLFFHAWFGAVCFAGACRRYRSDDGPALTTGLGLLLLAAWVATSAFAMLRWDDYRPSLLRNETVDVQVQFLGSLAAAMLLGIIPLGGAASAAADWQRRRAMNDPSLGPRPAWPLLAALGAAGLSVSLAAVPLAGPHLWTGEPSRLWFVPLDALVRTAVILLAFFTTTLYMLRVLRRRPGAKRMPLMALWLLLSWMAPMGLDTARWYFAADRYADVLGTASSFSPLGALVQAWTDRANLTTAGIAAQALLAIALAATFHLTVRRGAAPAS